MLQSFRAIWQRKPWHFYTKKITIFFSVFDGSIDTKLSEQMLNPP